LAGGAPICILGSVVAEGILELSETDGLSSLVVSITNDAPSAVLIDVEDPSAVLAALSPLATRDPAPSPVIGLTGRGAADLVHALRRLGLRAEAIDPSLSPAEARELLAQLAWPGS
jgi:AmiR/NasT family two-component response regulator